jgi:hypothetical protein
MKLHEPHDRPEIKDTKLNESYMQFKKLIIELNKRNLPDDLVASINIHIDTINSIPDSGVEFKKQIKKAFRAIVKQTEKQLKLVPRNYYRNTWMAVGMVVYGLSIGIVFGVSLGNMGYIGIGLPIGMAIGLAIGTGMDKKALKEGRQLDVNMKF